MGTRTSQILSMVVLAAAGLYTFAAIYSFSQARFFSVDEYQFGHATWLVARGAIPYVDFFEHHFPLSYVLHAPFYWHAWDYVTGALLLRKIVFAYWVVVAAVTGLACLAVTRDRLAAMLAALVPVSFGFSLMSAIDYRADNFGAVYFAACLPLLEWNRSQRRRGVAIACGVLAAIASLMTQKMTFIAGGTLAAMLVFDLALRRSRDRAPFIACPVAFFSSVAAVGALALAVGGALGMLPPGFESTIVQAVSHEQTYKAFSLFDKGYVTPFWEQTWASTLPMALLALGFLATPAGRFWIFPVAVSVTGGWLMAAPYPYNFVFLCWVAALASVRGFVQLVAWGRSRVQVLEDAGPLLYLLPLAAVANQLGFVDERITNDHQLDVLRKIERYGEPDDAVIDNAGGAMFSPDASYYFHHGAAHRQIFRDYFENELVEDYRRSRALFWISDMRARDLPKVARDYLHTHYVHGGDGLYVLGVRTPATSAEGFVMQFDAIRDGHYWFHRSDRDSRRSRLRTARGRGDVPPLVDGRPVVDDRIHLQAGLHEIRLPPFSPEYVVTLVDAGFFDPNPRPPRYSMMFQYREIETPEPRTHYSFADLLPESAEPLARKGAGDRIVQQLGSVVRFDAVLLPDQPRLRGHAQLLGELGESKRKGRLTISIQGPVHQDEISVPIAEPLRHPGFRIDSNLARFAGQEVELTISFTVPETVSASDLRIRWTGLRIDGEDRDILDPDADASPSDSQSR